MYDEYDRAGLHKRALVKVDGKKNPESKLYEVSVSVNGKKICQNSDSDWRTAYKKLLQTLKDTKGECKAPTDGVKNDHG